MTKRAKSAMGLGLIMGLIMSTTAVAETVTNPAPGPRPRPRPRPHGKELTHHRCAKGKKFNAESQRCEEGRGVATDGAHAH